MRPYRPTPPVLVAAALGAPLALGAALYPLRDSVSAANAVLLLVLVVVAVAASGHRPAGVLAALSSALWFDVFLTEPYLRPTISDRDDVETAVLLVVVGLAVTEVALWGIRHRARASGRAGYLDGIVAAARMAAAGDVPPAALVDVVARQITEVLGIDGCTFRAGGLSGHPRLEPDGSLAYGDLVLDVDRTGLPSGDVVEIAVRTGGAVVGTYVLTSATRTAWPSLEQRLVAVALADQVGPALARPSRPAS